MASMAIAKADCRWDWIVCCIVLECVGAKRELVLVWATKASDVTQYATTSDVAQYATISDVAQYATTSVD